MSEREFLAEYGDDVDLRLKNVRMLGRLGSPKPDFAAAEDLARLSVLAAERLGRAHPRLCWYVGLASETGVGPVEFASHLETALDSRPRRVLTRREVLRLAAGVGMMAGVIGLGFNRRAVAATPTTDWGVDSVAVVTASYNGTTLRQFAASLYNEPPDFWGRYFKSPGNSNITPFSGSEASALGNNGTHHVAPIQSPHQARLNNGYSTGHSDGMAACDDITNLIGNNNGSVQWPDKDGYVTLFLDVEAGTVLGQSYWNGWADAVYFYYVATNPMTTLPFLLGMYTDPEDSGRCSIVRNGPHAFNGMWSSTPSYFQGFPGDKPTKLKSWDPANNAPNHCSDQQTVVWQHALGGNWDSLQLHPPALEVDKDVSSPLLDDPYSWRLLYHMLHLP
jgi:hypothetical protein